MLTYLFQVSDIYLFVLLSVFSIVLSIAAVFIVKRYIPLAIRYKDDSVIGYISSLISIIYGVLVGITALYLINNISYTANAAQHEANAAANIYRESLWLKNPTQTKIFINLNKYLQEVINAEWPLMKAGQKIGHAGDEIIEQMSQDLHNYPLTTNSEMIIVRDLLENMNTLYDSRQQRIHMSYSTLNPDLWIVILIGTILTICINYLYGMNFYMHLFTMTASALMVSSMIFLLITLDRPFQGEFVIEPDAFQSLLLYMEKNSSMIEKQNIQKMEAH